jgi:hypothetical protein
VSATGEAWCWGRWFNQSFGGPYLDASIRTYDSYAGQVLDLTALNTAGEVYFGAVRQGQFGAGNTAVRRDNSGGLVFNATTGTTQPTSTGGNSSPPGVRLVAVAYERGAQCGLSDTGEVHCWTTFGGPVAPAPPPDVYIALDVGGYGGAALTADGRAVWWGTYAAELQAQTPTDTPFAEIAVGLPYISHGAACGVRVDGLLACFGDHYPWPGAPYF